MIWCCGYLIINYFVRDGYNQIITFSNHPLIGYWVDADGVSYIDAVFTVQFNSHADAIRMGKKHDQEYILRIMPDGQADLFKTN